MSVNTYTGDWVMENVMKAAAIAWNPIGEVRRRLSKGTLSASAMLVPFVGIVVACNIFVVGAQMFFIDALMYQSGGEILNNPLITSDYSQRLMSAVGVLAPIGAVAILPGGVFEPVGRNAIIAGMLTVFAGWSFYGAVFGVPFYYISGTIVTVDLELGLNTYMLLAVPLVILILVLALFFWFRILLFVLKLGSGQVVIISVVALLAIGVVTGFAIFIAGASSV